MTRLLMTTDAVGGVWQYSVELAAALRPLGVETILAVMGPGDGADAAGEVIRTGLALDWLATGAAEVASAGEAIAALARTEGADLVHVNSPTLAAANFSVPVVAVAHGCVGTWWQATRGGRPDGAYRWHGELMAQGLIAADATVAPSASFAAAVQRTYRLPAPPLVVHNGRTPPMLPAAGGDTQVFTAGRLWDEAKNAPLLDAVAAMIDVPFHAAGPIGGPQGEHVSLAHLRTLGTLDAAGIAARLADRPVYVSAATFEPFGLSVLEAAAAGCPLVLSDIDTFRELWGGAAILVPAHDASAYAAALGRIRADPAFARHLGEAARVRAGRYTPAAMAGAMAAIYAGLLPSGQRAAA